MVEAQTPCVLAITNADHNVPRIPKVRDVMAAHRQSLTTFTLADVGVDMSNRWYDVVELSIPTKETVCELLTVDELAQRLQEIAAAV